MQMHLETLSFLLFFPWKYNNYELLKLFIKPVHWLQKRNIEGKKLGQYAHVMWGNMGQYGQYAQVIWGNMGNMGK